MAWIGDLRYATRVLLRRPGLVLVAVVTLAIGIGANTAVFSLLDQVALRKLAVRQPEQLVVLDGPGPTIGFVEQASGFSSPFSYPMYLDLRDEGEATSGMLARFPAFVGVSHAGRTARVMAEVVSGNYFQLLGVEPAAGRLLTPADDREKGGHPVVVLSHASWVRRFGADPGVVGQSILVNGRSLEVVGVVGPEFRGVEVGLPPEIYLPMMMKSVATPQWDQLENRRAMWLNVMARLRPGVSADQALARLDTLYRQILDREAAEISVPEASRQRFRDKHLELLPGSRGRSDLRGSFGERLAVIAALVGLVLLVACANLANLLAARATERRREIAVRLALGASRGRLVRQLLLEAGLLAAAGAVLGVVLGAAILGAVVGLLPFEGAADAFSARPDGRLLVVATLLAGLTALLVGLLPALESTRSDLQRKLREDAGTVTVGRRQLLWRNLLVVGQVGLSVVVLLAAALFSRSLARLLAIDPGFRVAGLLGFSLNPALSGYDADGGRRLLQRLEVELGTLPGVHAVGLAVEPLLANSVWSSSVDVEGYEAADGEDMNPRFNAVGSGFFAAAGLPVLRGRGLLPSDTAESTRVAVINQTMAKRYFEGRDPVGARLYRGRRAEGGRRPDEVLIVGVVRDGVSANLREEVPRAVYLPFTQAYDGGRATVYLHTQGSPAAMGETVRRAVRAVDAQLPIYDLRSMEAQLAQSLFVERLAMGLSVALGALAAGLAALGLYGVLAYAVARRTRELGVRMALGAGSGDVFRLVLRDGLRPALAGVLCGLALALPATPLVRSVLYGIQPADPLSFVVVPVVLLLAALAACLVPAARAARTPPMRALRWE
jgi:predicted permease